MCRSVLLLLALSPFAQAQAKSTEAVAILRDGTKIRGTVVGEALLLQTDYGQLAVPTRELRRITFGAHFTKDERDLYEKHLKNLGSSNFGEREAATVWLKKQGWRCYPKVKPLAASEALEVAKRAEGIVTELTRLHPGQVRDTDDDIVSAVKFVSRGVLVGESLKIRTELLGELDLPLSTLVSLSFLGEIKTMEIEANKDWVDTGIVIEDGATVEAQAEGTLDNYATQPGQYMSGPDGIGGTKGKNNAFQSGALLARIGEEDRSVLVGSKRLLRGHGRLYLKINPNPWNSNSSGSYQVRLQPN